MSAARATPPPKLMSVAEAAALIGCSRGHIYNLAAAGELGQIVDIATPGARRTKSRLYPEAVAAYIGRASRPSLVSAVADRTERGHHGVR